MIRAGLAVAAHPSLWPTALRQLRRTARPQWWRRPPFLPVPTRSYVEFRLVTQYGDARHPVASEDVLNYLRWCRAWEQQST